ncbi:EAL domain protein [Shigella flexneri 2747-71]|nr:EAL domain protein [Shigella flexneri 2747-71]
MTSSQPAGWTAAELAQAAARGQLDLHYQPLVDLRDHRIAGAEALMRWRHPRLGLLPPGQFLPLAESFGLMPEIGAWVLGEACRQMHKWQGPAMATVPSCHQCVRQPGWANVRRRGKAGAGRYGPARRASGDRTDRIGRIRQSSPVRQFRRLARHRRALRRRRLRHRLFLPATSEMLPHHHIENRPILCRQAPG